MASNKTTKNEPTNKAARKIPSKSKIYPHTNLPADNGATETQNIPPKIESDTMEETSEHSQTEKEQARNNSNNSLKMNGITELIGNSSNIVFKAAGILEEEIARGILAAKQIEEKYPHLPKIRSGEITNNRQFDELFVRFRKDAHDIIDLFVDFAAIAAQNANKVTNQLISIGSSKSAPQNSFNQHLPLIQVPGELKAGEQISLPVTLENENAKEARTIIFVNTPLTDSYGNQLPATALTFDPNPLAIQPSSMGNVAISITIPTGAKPGNYVCFVQAQNSESLKATLMVKVV